MSHSPVSLTPLETESQEKTKEEVSLLPQRGASRRKPFRPLKPAADSSIGDERVGVTPQWFVESVATRMRPPVRYRSLCSCFAVLTPAKVSYDTVSHGPRQSKGERLGRKLAVRLWFGTSVSLARVTAAHEQFLTEICFSPSVRPSLSSILLAPMAQSGSRSE